MKGGYNIGGEDGRGGIVGDRGQRLVENRNTVEDGKFPGGQGCCFNNRHNTLPLTPKYFSVFSSQLLIIPQKKKTSIISHIFHQHSPFTQSFHSLHNSTEQF